MLSFISSRWLLVFGLLLLAPLAGCQQGATQFALLDADKDGLLSSDELDHNRDDTITPEEVQVKGTYTRRVADFFKDGGSTLEQKLNPAQFDRALLGNQMPGWMIGLVVLAVVGIPVPLGFQLAKTWRMPDHGWKIALMLLVITAGAAITYFGWPPKLGIDLSGGVILIYEIDEEATIQQGVAGSDTKRNGEALRDDEKINIDDVVAALRRRVNPGGVKEVIIRPYGERQVEIIVPEVEAAEIGYIKELIQRTGQLEFLIVANGRDHQELITKALSPEVLPQRDRNVAQAGDWKGRWVPVGVEERKRDMEPDYHGDVIGDVLRAKRKGSEGFVQVDIPGDLQSEIVSKRKNLKQVLDQLGYSDLQVLMVVHPTERFNIKGNHLRSATGGFDGSLNRAVNFTMKPDGAALLERLTSDNSPIGEFHRRLGILMDGELISAPSLNGVISRDGQITGNFSEEQVTFLVNILRAGRLPAVLRKEPISQNEVSALLGDDTIRQGGIAIGASLVITLVFMLFYYRFAGAVACMALLLNLLLTVAAMIAIRAAFTLPGIAGLVLGVGMSVDANILIFERIREEMQRGAGLRMALRNGFSRAATTIIDSNMTTLITAVVLYAIGTEQIKGFAVTLILGLMISMFTAIFCARVVFDVAERQRWITKLSMAQWIKQTNFDFIGKQRLAIGASLLLTVVGLGAVFARGQNILDIDFKGGTSVEILFKEPQPIDQVRAALSDTPLGDISVTLVSVEGYKDGRVYKIDTPITGEEAPAVGDVVAYTPPGAANSALFTVTAVDAEKQTVELKAEAGDSQFSAVKFANIQGDGVRIVQQHLIKIFGDKLERRSLEVTLDKAQSGETSASPSPSGNSASPASDDDLKPEAPATTTSEEAAPETTTPEASEPVGDVAPAETPATPAAEENSAAPEGGEQSAIAPAGFVFVALQDEQPPAAAEAVENATEAETAEAGNRTAAESAEEESAVEETPAASETTAVEESRDDGAPESGTVEETTASETEVAVVRAGRTQATLKFGHPVNAPTVIAAIRKAAANVLGMIELPGVRINNDDWDGSADRRLAEWKVELPLDEAASQRVLAAMENDLQGQPVWLSSNKIGPQIAGNLREVAIASLVFATLGIIGYIWFRFHRAVFGVAAVIAMLHDVLITLGAIGLSYYLATFLGFLGVDEFKINMTIVAALLTVIGYSLNDTVVVFDRIREVRGKNPDLTVPMVNQSVNQTLSRTLLTSFTTILSLVAMYAIGGPTIRGFAFTLLVGIVVGTFSSIYIASPCLLWLMKISKQVPNRPEKVKTPNLTEA